MGRILEIRSLYTMENGHLSLGGINAEILFM